MKRFLKDWCITALLFSSFSTQAQVASYPITGDFQDTVGGNDGIVYGASLANDRFGNENSAYFFDGINDYIEIPNDVSNNFGTNDDFTISIWIYISSLNNDLRGHNNEILGKWNAYNTSGYPYTIRYWNNIAVEGNQQKIFTNRFDSQYCGNGNQLTGKCGITLDTWHHIIYRKENEKITLFQDGELFGEKNDKTSLSCDTKNNFPVFIGKRDRNQRYFTGSIDELFFYNYAISDSDISSLFYENGWTKQIFESQFKSFNFQGISEIAEIDNINHIITIELDCYTDVTSLIAQFSTSEESIVTITGIEQFSGVNSNDYSIPVVYTLQNELHCFEHDWVVTVKLMEQNYSEQLAKTSFISFSIPEQIGNTIINNNTIEIEIPCHTDLTNLVADFYMPSGTEVFVNSTSQLSGSSSNDFSTSLSYSLINEEYCFEQDWVVTVNLMEQNDLEQLAKTSFISFSIPEQIGNSIINNNIIEIGIPCYIDLTNLKADFNMPNGVEVVANNVTQISGSTSNDFSTALNYTLINNEFCFEQEWIIQVNKLYIKNIDFQSSTHFIPNVITPNKDFLNEKFVLGSALIGSELIIFNRFGKIAYENSNYQNDFDAREVSSGVYFYELINQCLENPVKGVLHIFK